ncbi:prolyl 3-hydroxylase sudestada1 [Achroia grisella]|uniref:prolyl 3-hydroxylase sudestada1 n=1 Tax=Achroia grisella TaxID=688607 RepID=UPI0027D320A9|nr:prolyl 3-hydroxylase sudestada1 [Achroia grisella]
MNSPSKQNEEPSSSTEADSIMENSNGGEGVPTESLRPPAKRRLSGAVIEISDTESDDSDVCAVNSYQASADEVKRIRGKDYSSSSSSSDYSSDSESPWEDDSILLKDEVSNKPATRVQLNPRADRMEDPKLNPNIKSQELIDKLTSHWNEKKDFKTDEITLTCDPFRLCLVRDLLANPDIINNIVDDMNTLDWSRKKMDLYEFYQTADLSSLTWQRSIRGIHELLKTEVMSWVSQVTGLELRCMSSSCSLYGPGDRLLVHDDLLADRRVAFVLYLAPWRPPHQPLENGSGEHVHEEWSPGGGWRPQMGGALELLATDEAGHPQRAARRVYPRNNMLALFRVGTDSFHQVSEVVSLELPRLTINGWFHGPPPPPPAAGPAAEPEPVLPLPEPERLNNEVVLLNQWIESTYMTPRNRAQIQTQMERESEVSLRDFFLPEKYQELLQELREPSVRWIPAGPLQARRHAALCAEWAAALPAHHVLRQVRSLLASTTFARLLADCTDLQLTRLARLELQRWRAGDYALLPPREHYQRARLEVVVYVGVPERALSGGSTTFVAAEQPGDAALVTLPPVNNALSLVYCDPGAAAFTAYLSRLTMRPDDCFYVLCGTYCE